MRLHLRRTFATREAPAAGRRRSARVLAASLMAQTAGPLPTALLGTLGAQMMRDLGFDEVVLGAAVSTLFGACALTAAISGRVADAVGWARALRWGALTTVVALAGLALARDAATLILASLAGGPGLALVSTASNAALASEFHARMHGRVFGVKQSAYPLAGLLAGAALPTIAVTTSWRVVYALAATVPLVAIACAPAVGRSSATGAPRRRRERAPRPLVLFATAAAIGIAAATALSSFIVVYGVTLGLPEGLLGAVVASASVVALAVRLGVGWAADRLSRSGLRAVAALVGLLALGIVLVMSGIPALFVAGAYIALGPGWGWGGLVRSGVVRVQPSAGSATGVIESGMNGGAAVGGILFGYAASTLGYHTAWGVLAALVMAASLMGWVAASGLHARTARPDRSGQAGQPRS